MQHKKLHSDRSSWVVNEFFLHSFHISTSMTLSKQEIDHPTSSSSSSTTPTTTVSSDSENWAREDLSGTDSHPALVSSSHVERKERRDPFTKPTKNPTNENEDHGAERSDPLYSDFQEWLQDFRANIVDVWSLFRADRKEKCGSG